MTPSQRKRFESNHQKCSLHTGQDSQSTLTDQHIRRGVQQRRRGGRASGVHRRVLGVPRHHGRHARHDPRDVHPPARLVQTALDGRDESAQRAEEVRGRRRVEEFEGVDGECGGEEGEWEVHEGGVEGMGET